MDRRTILILTTIPKREQVLLQDENDKINLEGILDMFRAQNFEIRYKSVYIELVSKNQQRHKALNSLKTILERDGKQSYIRILIQD